MSLRFAAALVAVSCALSLTPADQGLRASTQSTRSAPLFSFQSNAWLNLHHYVRASARGRPEPPGLAEDERQIWTTGVAFYKPYAGRDLLADEGMVAIKQALRGAAGKTNLDGIAIDAELKATLERLMPIYQKHLWPQHDRDNRAWIAAEQPLLDRHGAALAQAVTRVYDSSWPGEPVPVDLSVTAGPVGAYTSNDPLHVTIASTDKGYQGYGGLEMLFHEASHSSVSNLYQHVSRAATEAKVTVPPALWHAVLFYTAGELTVRELSKHGVAYTPYANEGLYINLCGAGCRDRIVEHWTPRLDGRRSVSEALAALVVAFR